MGTDSSTTAQLLQWPLKSRGVASSPVRFQFELGLWRSGGRDRDDLERAQSGLSVGSLPVSERPNGCRCTQPPHGWFVRRSRQRSSYVLTGLCKLPAAVHRRDLPRTASPVRSTHRHTGGLIHLLLP